eukprot:109653_1
MVILNNTQLRTQHCNKIRNHRSMFHANNRLNYSQLIEGLTKYKAMVNYNKKKHNAIYISNLAEILNQFGDVLQHPHQNQLLASIFNQLEYCDVSTCVMLQRNYRNGSKYNNKTSIYDLYGTDDDHLIAGCQLMDNIHCFFHHSYDDGNRLSIEDQNILNQSDQNEAQFNTLKQILSPWRKQTKLLIPWVYSILYELVEFIRRTKRCS